MRDNHPRIRQQAKLERKAAFRTGDVILVVCEGKKTEPQYFREIAEALRLPSVNYSFVHPECTEPKQLVDDAEDRLLKNREYDRVYVVFDRDEHRTFYDALVYAKQLDGKYKSTNDKPIPFIVIPSIPNFELWLLLHYEDVQHSLHRKEVLKKLKTHIKGYDKGQKGTYAITKDSIEAATSKAKKLCKKHSPHDKLEPPYTNVHELIEQLHKMDKERRKKG